jgi:hypothetical protein
MIQHAEILFYVFRDNLISFGPSSILESVEIVGGLKKVEFQLGIVSGVEHKPLRLDEEDLVLPHLTEEEWVEVFQLFETKFKFYSGSKVEM